MKKLAFEYGMGGFQMPSLKLIGLEKENNLVFATPNTVYKPSSGSSGSFTHNEKIITAMKGELDVFGGLS